MPVWHVLHSSGCQDCWKILSMALMSKCAMKLACHCSLYEPVFIMNGWSPILGGWTREFHNPSHVAPQSIIWGTGYIRIRCILVAGRVYVENGVIAVGVCNLPVFRGLRSFPSPAQISYRLNPDNYQREGQKFALSVPPRIENKCSWGEIAWCQGFRWDYKARWSNMSRCDLMKL